MKTPRVLGREYVTPGPKVAGHDMDAIRRHARNYPFTTTVQYAPEGLAAAKYIDLERLDARYECDGCGRLPHEGCRCASPATVVEQLREPKSLERPALTKPMFIQPEEAEQMLDAPTPDTEAPYGRKADGSPKKKPGRPPRGDGPKRKRRTTRRRTTRASATGAAAPKLTAAPPPDEESTLARLRRETHDRIAVLDSELAAQREQRDRLNAQIHETDGERKRLAKALAAFG